MKNLVFTLFGFYALSVSLAWSDQKIALGDAYGKGDQYTYFIDTWKGKEQLISRLIKEDDNIEFVRVSKDEFEVRRQQPATEIFFRFSKDLDPMSPGLEMAHLVDFLREGDQAAVLMIGVRGYFYMRASSSAPKVEPPNYFFPNIKLIKGQWIPRYIVPARDFYRGTGGPVTEKIALARLKALNEIEFTLKPDAEEPPKVDVFSIHKNSISKNNVECVFSGVGEARELGIIDEDKFAASFLKDTVDRIKDSFARSGHTKNDVLDLISRFQNREAAGKIEERLDKVFPNDENGSE